MKRLTCINLVSYVLLKAKDPTAQHIQIASDDTDVFVFLVWFCWKYHISKTVTKKKMDGKIIYINKTTMLAAATTSCCHRL